MLWTSRRLHFSSQSPTKAKGSSQNAYSKHCDRIVGWEGNSYSIANGIWVSPVCFGKEICEVRKNQYPPYDTPDHSSDKDIVWLFFLFSLSERITFFKLNVSFRWRDKALPSKLYPNPQSQNIPQFPFLYSTGLRPMLLRQTG